MQLNFAMCPGIDSARHIIFYAANNPVLLRNNISAIVCLIRALCTKNQR